MMKRRKLNKYDSNGGLPQKRKWASGFQVSNKFLDHKRINKDSADIMMPPFQDYVNSEKEISRYNFVLSSVNLGFELKFNKDTDLLQERVGGAQSVFWNENAQTEPRQQARCRKQDHVLIGRNASSDCLVSCYMKYCMLIYFFSLSLQFNDCRYYSWQSACTEDTVFPNLM